MIRDVQSKSYTLQVGQSGYAVAVIDAEGNCKIDDPSMSSSSERTEERVVAERLCSIKQKSTIITFIHINSFHVQREVMINNQK
jgi:hypothetical protein